MDPNRGGPEEWRSDPFRRPDGSAGGTCRWRLAACPVAGPATVSIVLEESEDLAHWADAATLGPRSMGSGLHAGEARIAEGPPWLRLRIASDGAPGADRGPGGSGASLDVGFDWDQEADMGNRSAPPPRETEP